MNTTSHVMKVGLVGWDWWGLAEVNEETRLLKEENDWSNGCKANYINQNDCYGKLSIKAERSWKLEGWKSYE